MTKRRYLFEKILIVLLISCMLSGWMPCTAVHADTVEPNQFLAPVEAPDASAVKISSAEDLKNIRNDLYGSYVLTQDIDLSGQDNWDPIGKNLSGAFRGKLDGQGHKITGLKNAGSFSNSTISPTSPYAVGLFGVCDGAEIKNLAIENENVGVNNSSGYIYESVKIDSGNVYAGGIVGYAENGTIIYNCHSSGSVLAKGSGEAQAKTFAGGLVGFGSDFVISYSYFDGNVNTSYNSSMFGFDSYAGGLIGYADSNGRVDCSYNSGSVKAAVGDYTVAYAGGLIGGAADACSLSVTNCFNEGQVLCNTGNSLFGGENAYAGGLAGAFSGSIDKTYNTGKVSAVVRDSYGIATGNCYAGGICAHNTDSAEISNSVSAAPDIIARKGDSRRTDTQYYISDVGKYTNNIICSSLTGSSDTPSSSIRTEAELKQQKVYENILSWDFEKYWTIQEGVAYPRIKPVNTESDSYNDEYIAQHLNFIQGDVYKNIISKNRWAQIYWSSQNTIQVNNAEQLYRAADFVFDPSASKFKDLLDENGSYKVIVLDYVSDQATKEAIHELYKVQIPYSMDSVYKKVSSFIKDNWEDPWGKLSDEDIFWLFHYSEQPAEGWINSDFEEHISEIVSSSKKDELADALHISDDILTSVIDGKSKVYDSIVDWFNGFLQEAGHVDAFLSASEEFKTILRTMCDNLPASTPEEFKNAVLLRDAITDYTLYKSMKEDDIKKTVFNMELLDSGLDQIWDFCYKAFTNEISGWIKTFPDSVQASLNLIKFTAKSTWKLCEYITKNGDLMDCRQMLRCNAYFEESMYRSLKQIEETFVSSPSLENARLFDAAFAFFKECQIYSMDTCISLFETYQISWPAAIEHLSNTFMHSAIEQVLINKLFLYDTYCHGTTYFVGAKVIIIACPTDVTVLDADNQAVLTIENDEIQRNVPGCFACVSSHVKVLALPADQNYSIQIKGTDNGSMDYHVSEYDSSMNNTRLTVYSALPLTSGAVYTGKISDQMQASPESYALTSDSFQTDGSFQYMTSDIHVVVNSVSIVNAPSELTVGDTAALQAVLTPVNPFVNTVIWHSSDPDILRVSEQGVVQAVGEGTASIYADSLMGGVQDSVSITVNKKTPVTDHTSEQHTDMTKPSEPPQPTAAPQPADTPDVPDKTQFTDISQTDWCYKAVQWALEKDITSGTTQTTFSPDNPCTRAQTVTFLWKLAGRPEPSISENPFTDVDTNAWYYKAVLWAFQKNITSGTTSNTFSPDQPCSRAQMVTYLWNYSGKPEPQTDFRTFTDVRNGIWYEKPVSWAVANGITAGTDENAFSPDDTCTRAQSVTMLYRMAASHA